MIASLAQLTFQLLVDGSSFVTKLFEIVQQLYLVTANMEAVGSYDL